MYGCCVGDRATMQGYGQVIAESAEMLAFWEPQARLLAEKVSDLRVWLVQKSGMTGFPAAVVAVGMIDEARAHLRATTSMFDASKETGDWTSPQDAALQHELKQAEDLYWGAVGTLTSAGLPVAASVPTGRITSAAPPAPPPEAEGVIKPESEPAPTEVAPGTDAAMAKAKAPINWVLWGGIALALMAATGSGFFVGRR